MRSCASAVFVLSCLLGWLSAAAGPGLDHSRVVGPEECGECHSNEVDAWRKTPHATTFNDMHRRPEAEEIAEKLGIRRVRAESLCLDCHYTSKSSEAERSSVIAGVSCESCHGAARDWINVHNDYGPHGDKASEPAQHRQARIARAVDAGMLNPASIYDVAQNCFQCHLVPNERLVNTGGHPAGSPDFELVSWLHGEVRHNFLRTDGASNADNDQPRKRLMYVTGVILDLEHSLRGTAIATERGAYGVTLARRANAVRTRLAEIESRIATEELAAIVAASKDLRLALNNADELNAAAEQIASLGRRFASNHDGSAFAAIDDLIPGPSQYRGSPHQP